MPSRFPNNALWNAWERPTTTTTSSTTSPPPFTPVVQEYTAGSYYFSKIPGATNIKVELVGAGGGGGKVYNFSPYFGGGGGGGGGGYSVFNIVLATLIEPLHLYVGFGGALAGTAGFGTPGQSSFFQDAALTVDVFVLGGLGGEPATFPGAGGFGGAGVSGNVNLGGDGGKGADGALVGGTPGVTGFVGFGTQGTGGKGGEGDSDPYAGYGVDGFARLTWT